MKLLSAAFVISYVTLSSAPALSQTWSNPDAPSNSTQSNKATTEQDPSNAGELAPFLEELNALLDRGEKERLADPWYLRELRELVAKYANPWNTLLFRDDFSSRSRVPKKPWRVTQGEFLIDWRYGMRSVVEPAPSQSNQRIQSSDPKDLARILLGTILSGSANQSSGTPQNQAPKGPAFAAIQAETRLTNAFAIDLEISAQDLRDASSGRGANGFEFGPYQGKNAAAGYRLSYTAPNSNGASNEEKQGSLKLLRISQRRGVGVIEFGSKPVNFEDGEPHHVLWTRDLQGRTVVLVDGVTIIDTVDRSFRDPFDGLVYINRGGDYSVRQVAIAGTE